MRPDGQSNATERREGSNHDANAGEWRALPRATARAAFEVCRLRARLFDRMGARTLRCWDTRLMCDRRA